jgi:hypothetical protein
MGIKRQSVKSDLTHAAVGETSKKCFGAFLKLEQNHRVSDLKSVKKLKLKSLKISPVS